MVSLWGVLVVYLLNVLDDGGGFALGWDGARRAVEEAMSFRSVKDGVCVI